MSGLPPGLSAALRERLGGAFVQRVAAGDELLVIEARAPGRSQSLVLSVLDGAAGAFVVDEPPRLQAPDGGLLSFRDHARGALTGLRLADARLAGSGRFLVLDFEGAAGRAALVLDGGPRPNLALVQGASSHSLRRPHAREGTPEQWLALPADAEATPSDLDVLGASLLESRDARLSRERLLRGSRELRAALSAARRLVSRREDDVARLGDATSQRALADALAATLHHVRQGQSSVTVTRLDDGSEATIALDPRLPPGELLRRQYRLAAKAERGEQEARRQLQLARERAASLETCADRARQIAEALGDALPSAGDREVIAEWARECERLLPRRPERQAKAEARRAAPSLPEGVREFTSRDGLRILAGRSATSNDALTFRIARGNDAWLHARDVPGPHVVLVLPKGAEIPQESLLDAATVAHVLGQLGDEPRGEVIWTRAKDVRRVKGAGPGRVTVARERVLPLRVEPERVARLRLRVPNV